jgi:hypothetical protein
LVLGDDGSGVSTTDENPAAAEAINRA